MLWLPAGLHMICRGCCETLLSKRSKVKGEGEKKTQNETKPSYIYKDSVRFGHGTF